MNGRSESLHFDLKYAWPHKPFSIRNIRESRNTTRCHSYVRRERSVCRYNPFPSHDLLGFRVWEFYDGRTGLSSEAERDVSSTMRSRPMKYELLVGVLISVVKHITCMMTYHSRGGTTDWLKVSFD